MLAFVLNFGLMVADLITKRNDEFWKLYKLQQEILSVALQNTIENSTPALFEKLVMEHHTLYIKLIGNLFPKQHLLTYYADIMRKFGPVINTWCM